MTDDQLDKMLRAGLEALEQPMPEGSIGKLAEYLRLLDKWNQTWNLTAVRDPLAMVARHVLDSLSIRPWVVGPDIADVGTGAGLPGVPLAIAEPTGHFVLIDSAAKRTRFVTQAAATLGLTNVTVVRSRAQDYHPDSAFDTVISRAFASLADFTAAAGHLAKTGGRLLAMKGQLPSAEIAELSGAWRASTVEAIAVPGLEAQRHVVVLNAVIGAAGQE